MQTVLKILLLLVFPLFSFCQKKLLQHNYNFFGPDGIAKLHQSHDTLYGLKCPAEEPDCIAHEHYKIISIEHTGEFDILKLEKLDTTTHVDRYPATRYSICAFRDINEKQLGALTLKSGLTRQQLDTVHINVPALKDKFSLTFFSDSYMKELSKLKKITTVQQVKEIVAAIKSKLNSAAVQQWKRTETRDALAAIVWELQTKVCIEKGYSPVGAEEAINSIVRKNHLQSSDF